MNLPPQGNKPSGAKSNVSNSSTPTAVSPTLNGDFVWSTVGAQCGAEAGVKIMCYAESGVGKTVLMATLPQPFIVISTENGLLSLSVKNLTKIFIELGMEPADAEERANGVKQQRVMIVRNGLQLRRAYEYLSKPENLKTYKSVGWDGASDMAEVMLDASKAIKADGRQAYGEIADIIRDYYRKFRDNLPGKHVYITCKQGSVKDDVSGIIKWGPDFPGKQLSQATPYFMDETFHLGVATDPESNTTYRYLQTQPNEHYGAKDRSGMLDVWEKPDLSAIIDKITAQV